MAANSGNNERDINGDEDEDDLARRFPDLNADERLQAARGGLPDPPVPTYVRPTFKKVDPMGDGGRFGRTTGGLKPDDLRGAGLAYTAGIQFVAIIMAGTGVGWLVDRYLLHSTGTPWGIIGGFLFGCVGGFSGILRLTRQLNDE